MPPRRFPPPWDIEEHNRSCFIVRDNNGQALAPLPPYRHTSYCFLKRQAAGAAEAAAVLVEWEPPKSTKAHRIAANRLLDDFTPCFRHSP